MHNQQKPLRDKILTLMKGLPQVTVVDVIGTLDAAKVTFSVDSVYKALSGMIDDGLVRVDEGDVLTDKKMLRFMEDSMSNDLKRQAKVQAIRSTSYALTTKGLLLLKMKHLTETSSPRDVPMQKRGPKTETRKIPPKQRSKTTTRSR